MGSNLVEILQTTVGLSDDALQEAQQIRRENDSRLGEILIQNRILTEKQLLEAYSVLYQIPFWSELPLENIGNDFTHTVPIQFLKKYFLVPLECSGQDQTLQRLLPTASGSGCRFFC